MNKRIQKGWTLFGTFIVILCSGAGAVLMLWMGSKSDSVIVPWGAAAIQLAVLAAIYAMSQSLIELKSLDTLENEEKEHLGIIIDVKLGRIKTVQFAEIALLLLVALLAISKFSFPYINAIIGMILGASIASLILVYEEQKEVKNFESELKNRAQTKKAREELLKAMNEDNPD